MTPEEALAEVRAADEEVTVANVNARRIQRAAGDRRALAVADLVALVGTREAMGLLDVGEGAIYKATTRANAVRRARDSGA
jgi:hypothetical protein